MARTPEGALLTQRHRSRQLAIRAAALRDLTRLWRAVDPLNLGDTIGPFAAASAVVVRARNRDSAAVAARYYEAFRRVEGVRGALSIVLGDAPPAEVAAGAVRGAGLAGIIRARQRGFSPQASASRGFRRAAGTTSNLVLSGARSVITEATASDRASTGRWQRITASDPCSFCAMLAARGPVFTAGGGVSTTSDITFAAHSACACMAEPAYEGTRLPPASERFRELWDESTPGLSGDDAMNAFRRAREGRPLEGDPITEQPAAATAA